MDTREEALHLVSQFDVKMMTMKKMTVRERWPANIAPSFPFPVKPYILFSSIKSSDVYCMAFWNFSNHILKSYQIKCKQTVIFL